MTTRSPDPVLEARAYQELLLSLLGTDDPATVQAQTFEQIEATIADAGEHLHTTPAPGEWSVWGCLAHLVDAEIAASGRYRWILTNDRPNLPGYDQDLWVEKTHSPDESIDQLLAIWQPLRQANLRLWNASSLAERERVGLHQERGPESYDLTFRMIAGHDRFHLDQMRNTIAAVRRGLAPE
ncbi:MAG TPA: DinB family protein [Acidimicrobiia bacterium]|nr:DinB family protein [Acidimicrobiia bacterium]